MPEISFMTIDQIEGDSNVKDHENEIEVLEFEHQVAKEVDPLDCSKVRSDRHHGVVTFVKRFDKATPLLEQRLCEGGLIDKIEIKWFRQPASGSGAPEHYFTHTFEKCIVTAVQPYMPNALNPEFKAYGHMEKVCFGYGQVTWKSETGGTEFTDDTRS